LLIPIRYTITSDLGGGIVLSISVETIEVNDEADAHETGALVHRIAAAFLNGAGTAAAEDVAGGSS
jgi:hypothetical protein